MAHGLSCPMACGILVSDQGSNPCPLRWKVDSLPLDHQGSPVMIALLITTICISCLLLHKNLPPQLNGLKQQTLITSQGLSGSGIQEQLGWLVLAQGLS